MRINNDPLSWPFHRCIRRRAVDYGGPGICRRHRIGRSNPDALKPKPATRGLSTGPQVDTAAQAKEASFVDTLRNRKTRSLSLGEREEIVELAGDQAEDHLEIRFDYNSADISRNSMPAVRNSARRSRTPA